MISWVEGLVEILRERQMPFQEEWKDENKHLNKM